MAAAFTHLEVSKESLKQAFAENKHNLYRKVVDKFAHFVLLGSVSPDNAYRASREDI